MASGTPVVCSNATSLPEIAGDADLMHAPEDMDILTYYLQMMAKGYAAKADDDQRRTYASRQFF